MRDRRTKLLLVSGVRWMGEDIRVFKGFIRGDRDTGVEQRGAIESLDRDRQSMYGLGVITDEESGPVMPPDRAPGQ